MWASVEAKGCYWYWVIFLNPFPHYFLKNIYLVFYYKFVSKSVWKSVQVYGGQWCQILLELQELWVESVDVDSGNWTWALPLQEQYLLWTIEPSSLLTFHTIFFKARSFTDMELVILVRLDGQRLLGFCLSPTSRAGVTSAQRHTCIFRWILGIGTQVLMLVRQTFYPLSISPRHRW